MHTPAPQEASHSGRSAAALLIAASFGAGCGWLLARIASAENFAWVGLMIAPLWVALELGAEALVGVLGKRSRADHVLSIVGVLAGFYLVWFVVRGLAP